jgi:hypothetical protein
MYWFCRWWEHSVVFELRLGIMKKCLVMILLSSGLLFSKSYYIQQSVPKNRSVGSKAVLVNASINTFVNIQDGVNKLTAGDTLAVAPGVYNERVSTKANGTSSKSIVIKADSSGEVILNGFSIDHSYINLIGFTIQGINCDAITINKGVVGINILENKITVLDTGFYIAINCPGGTNAHETEKMLIKGNVFGPTSKAGNICMRLRGKFHEVTNNVFNYWNGKDAINMIASESKITNNLFNSISHSPTSTLHPDCIQIYVENNSNQKNVLIEGNVMRNCSGQGIRMYQDVAASQTCSTWTIRNNLFINIGAKALQTRGFNCNVLNNLFYYATTNTGHPLGFLEDNKNSRAINNVFIGCGSVPASNNAGWWNEDQSAPIEHSNNMVAGPAPLYQGKSATSFSEKGGINGGDPCFENAHIGWVWADNNGNSYDGTVSSFEVNLQEISKFKIGEFIEYSPFYLGPDSIARQIVSISGDIVSFSPAIKQNCYQEVACNIPKENYYSDNTVCNIIIVLWGKQSWSPGNKIVPKFSLKSNSPLIGKGLDLSHLGFTNDFRDAIRTNGWEIGPYEFYLTTKGKPQKMKLLF